MVKEMLQLQQKTLVQSASVDISYWLVPKDRLKLTDDIRDAIIDQDWCLFLRLFVSRRRNMCDKASRSSFLSVLL